MGLYGPQQPRAIPPFDGAYGRWGCILLTAYLGGLVGYRGTRRLGLPPAWWARWRRGSWSPAAAACKRSSPFRRPALPRIYLCLVALWLGFKTGLHTAVGVPGPVGLPCRRLLGELGISTLAVTACGR